MLWITEFIALHKTNKNELIYFIFLILINYF